MVNRERVESSKKTPEKPGPASYAYTLTYPGDERRGNLSALFVNHGTDARWPQVKLLQTHWDNFWKQNKDPKTVAVIHEGPRYDIRYMDFEHIIREHSEPGHLMYLSLDKPALTLLSGESEDFGIAATQHFLEDNPQVKGKLDIDNIKLLGYYFFGRLYPQYAEGKIKKPFREYVEGNASFQKMRQLGFVYDDLARTHEALYPNIPHRNFEHNDDFADFLREQTIGTYYQDVPEERRTLIQKVAQACNNSRDQHVADLIAENMDKGDVFIAFGAPHWFPIQKALHEKGIPVDAKLMLNPSN